MRQDAELRSREDRTGQDEDRQWGRRDGMGCATHRVRKGKTDVSSAAQMAHARECARVVTPWCQVRRAVSVRCRRRVQRDGRRRCACMCAVAVSGQPCEPPAVHRCTPPPPAHLCFEHALPLYTGALCALVRACGCDVSRSGCVAPAASSCCALSSADADWSGARKTSVPEGDETGQRTRMRRKEEGGERSGGKGRRR